MTAAGKKMEMHPEQLSLQGGWRPPGSMRIHRRRAMIPQAGGFVSSETMVSAAILTGYTGTASNMLVKVNDYSAYLTGTNMMTGAMGQANYQSIKGSSKAVTNWVISMGLSNPKLDNIVSQSQNVNLSTYKKIENQWANAISNGQEVTVKVDIKYSGDSLRPTELDVEYTIDGEFFNQDILN